MEEEILLELKTLNERLAKDFELRSEQLKIEQARFENELELQSIAEAEKVEQDAQLELDRAKSEQRALQIEQYIEKVQSDEELEKQELSRQEMIQAINEIDNTDTLTQINEKLTELIEVNPGLKMGSTIHVIVLKLPRKYSSNYKHLETA